MKFSEFIESRKHYYIESLIADIDSLLTEYNTYLQEEQNKPITSEFLLGLGFTEVGYFSKNYYISNGKLEYDIHIDLIVNAMYIIDMGINALDNKNLYLPYPKTQKDVLDLMRLLQLY